MAIAPAAAEDLYNKDGVQLWTSARMVTRDAATCHILEDRHSEEEFERLKANEGQPLHLWRMDLSATNYSGKVVEYLRASVDVESDWPPCTNWDWETVQDYAGGVDWAGGILSLQQVADMSAGEEERETMFLLVFHDQEPGFGRWSIDYNFAEAAPAPAERGVPGARPTSGSPARPSAAPPSRSAAADQPRLIDHMRRAARREPSAAVERPSRQPGEAFRDTLRSGGTGPEMVVIPAGSFRMGCISGVGCYNDEKPVHQVTIPQAFAVGKYEVTFAEWDACVSAGGCSHRPDDRWGRGRHPVIRVSWDDAQSYVRWLSQQTGASYRLLSESEWEYVARAGSSTAYSWGSQIGSGRANCDGCGSQWDNSQTAPVGSFSPNAFGLHDMHGNVWEWVQDCWNESYNGGPSDGSAWQSGNCFRRVLRGGSWNIRPRHLRSANRIGYPSDDRSYLFGFRVARTLTPKPAGW